MMDCSGDVESEDVVDCSGDVESGDMMDCSGDGITDIDDAIVSNSLREGVKDGVILRGVKDRVNLRDVVKYGVSS